MIKSWLVSIDCRHLRKCIYQEKEFWVSLHKFFNDFFSTLVYITKKINLVKITEHFTFSKKKTSPKVNK